MNADVVIAGAGPNGLMLACELGLAGLRPLLLERLAGPSDEPKANGLVGQVVTMVDRRGLYERLGGGPGPPRPNAGYFMFAALRLDLSLLDSSPLYTLSVPQRRIAQVLQERALELGAEIRWGHELADLSQDDDAVTVDVVGPDGPYRLRTRYLVGADGAHSATRKRAGIAFPGVTYDRTVSRTAHAMVPAPWIDPATGALAVPGHGIVLPFLPHRTERGGFGFAPLPGQPPLVSTMEWDRPETDLPMSLDELSASIRRVLGVNVPLAPPTGDGPHVLRRLAGGSARLAERFRDRHVLLVGDAAHLFAAGGQGLNVGMQDAINLGWKLAAEIRGGAPAGLLDSYETERRAVARRVMMFGQAQSALLAPGNDVTELRELFAELLGYRDAVRHIAELTAGSDVRYDMGGPGGHPLVGRCAPDMELATATAAKRLAELTRSARPLLLDFTEDGSPATALSRRRDRVDIVAARPAQPVAATALLLRPDSYVAWASSSPRPDAGELEALQAAAERWFGTAPGRRLP